MEIIIFNFLVRIKESQKVSFLKMNNNFPYVFNTLKIKIVVISGRYPDISSKF